jgi:predicted RNA-binding protein associated with RNAse of E/G family
MSEPAITIRKLDHTGREVFSYPGTVLERTATAVTVEAFFGRYDRLDLGYTVFERGDRFVEYFFADRWYNIFEVYAVRDQALRGWYCNLTRPAIIHEHEVSAVDLALDVWVDPFGQAQVLDEAEFAALPLSADESRAVRAACAELLALAAQHAGPFSLKG